MSIIGTHCTTVATSGGVTRVTYHETVVVAFDDKQITLDTDGYFTPTTKTRMNQTSFQFDLGFHVYQEEGHWYVDYNGEIIAFGPGTMVTLSR